MSVYLDGWPRKVPWLAFFVSVSETKGVSLLILSRKAGEKIVIGDNVVVTVVSVKGKQTLLGIEAPLEIQVHREEVYQRILMEREAEKIRAAVFLDQTD